MGRFERMRKNQKQFGVWLPLETHKWFEAWLKHNSIGNDTSERFRQFLYKLQEGKSTHSSVSIGQKICLREILQGTVKDPKRTLCKICKTKFPFSFRNCQDPEKEARYWLP